VDTFSELPVRDGVGPWHLNYFRVFTSVAHNRVLPNGPGLMGMMHDLLKNGGASVVPEAKTWKTRSTLAFTGVAKIKPFSRVGFDDFASFTLPPLHIDSVGLPIPAVAHSFTAQTLKRNYESPEDRAIRKIARIYLTNDGKKLREARNRINRRDPSRSNDIIDDIVRWVENRAVDAAEDARKLEAQLIDKLCDYAVFVNQHHFLAGRRSFWIGRISDFKPSQVDLRNAHVKPPLADLWVFETAAVERFSRWDFLGTTEAVMGGNTKMIEPIWIAMCENVASKFGASNGSIEVKHDTVWSESSVLQSPVYHAIKDRHAALLPNR
jgi:hypothetical protein